MILKGKISLICATALVLCGLTPYIVTLSNKAIRKYETLLCRPDVAIYGPIIMADGIGRQTVELAQALTKKYTVQIISDFVVKADVPTAIKDILKIKYKKPAPVVIVERSLWTPGDSLDRIFSTVDSKTQIRYAYSMLESTRIPAEWAALINLYFDAVIVPDPFLIEAYLKSGVTVPIFHIPLGLNIADLLESPLKKTKAKGPLIFASLGAALDRKNHIMAIQAFAKALGNNPNAQLFINCRESTPKMTQEICDEIAKHHCNNIKYTELRLRKDAYVKFFQSIDCLLSFSKGEGFSIQPREAMALGIPAIVTNNTAQTTICNSGLVKVVSSNIPEPCYYFGRSISDGERFNCDLEECSAAIQDVYLNYDKYLEKGPMMRQWAASYDYSCLTSQYECLVSPKKVVLGEVNEITEDCIYTNSQSLYEKYVSMLKNK